MRVIKFLLSSLIFLIIFGGIGGLLAREALLFSGASMIRSSLTVLHKVSRDNLQFARQCREKGGVSEDSPTIGNVQIRFITKKQYVIEVLCSQFTSDPILIEKYTLPPFVVKRPGSSGIIWGDERSFVELDVYGRQTIIGVENQEIKSFSGGSVSLGLSPQSTCEGYGYMCCQPETQSGVGQSFAGVNDCPRGCYAQCLPRPIILSLNTDPFVAEQTRTTTVLQGQPVTFSYVASYEKKEPVSIVLDFGDGQQQTFTKLTGSIAHTYACPNGNCTFDAQLTASASSGVVSASTPITQIKVKVQ